jgi:hypothetical protein
MSWILNNLFDNMPPSFNDLLYVSEFVSEKALLCAFKVIAKVTAKIPPKLTPYVSIDIEPEMIRYMVKLNYAQLLQWLHSQGLSITVEVVEEAARWSRIKVLKMIYEIDPALVCIKEVANLAAKNWSIWKYDVLDWIWETCRMLPKMLGEDDYLREWVVARKQR